MKINVLKMPKCNHGPIHLCHNASKTSFHQFVQSQCRQKIHAKITYLKLHSQIWPPSIKDPLSEGAKKLKTFLKEGLHNH